MATRRQVLAAAAALLAAPAASRAQAKPARIGFLGVSRAYEKQSRALLAGLRERGWIEGKSYVMEYRWADGNFDQLAQLAVELVRAKVDVLVTHSTPGCLAAKKATSTIPIVMSSVTDPLGTGLVSDMARPGANITGVTNLDAGLAPKRLGVLKELVPKLARVAVLRNPGNPSSKAQLKETQSAAQVLGITFEVAAARDAGELPAALSAIGRMKPQALVTMADPMFIAEQKRIAAFALGERLPTLFARNENVEAGGLVSYGPTIEDQFHQAAAYVDRILKGAKPGELPVEQPTRFKLVINLRTAKALGLSIPPSLIAQADQLIR
jgi:putative ABC transport system substrate-binding protein